MSEGLEFEEAVKEEKPRVCGLWGREDVPKRNWGCVDVEDLREPSMVCEMCQFQVIRYVHHMKHPNYPKLLLVGCVCAGRMELNVEAAKAREKHLRQIAIRRISWLLRKWRRSEKGNLFLNTQSGHNVVVFPQGDGWSFRIKDRRQQNGDVWFPSERRTFATCEEAQLGAFDRLLLLMGDRVMLR